MSASSATTAAMPAVMPTYNRAAVAFERGEGPWLYASDGKRYLDFGSGIAVTALGHSHPHLVQALVEQGQKLWHCSNIFSIPGQEKLGRRMVETSFADTVFFGNSGAEAMECAIKMVRKYHHANGEPHRIGIICATGAFHGRTLTTIFAGGQAKHIEGFGPAVQGFTHVAFGNLNEMRAAIGPETGAILVEPMQGEGGYKPAPEGYLKGLREACDEFGLLLVFDEVQTGNGRTGKLWAYEHAGIAPDIMATAKGLGGGFPVGACLATAEAAKGMTAGTHGSTFGGNPLAMAVANAVYDVLLAPGFLAGVERTGKAFLAAMKKAAAKHPAIFLEARGLGLMVGLKCVDAVPCADMVKALREHGLLTIGAGDNVVRLAPPLIVDESHIAEASAIIDKAAAGWKPQAGNGHAKA
jgi:acetylornithine/N-succinyldiaminopimelate aminotransferase